MEIGVLDEDNNNISLEIKGEGHTLCNLFRYELWKLGVDSCGYNLKHPIISSPVLNVEASKPRKMIQSCVDEARKEVKALRSEFSKKIK